MRVLATLLLLIALSALSSVIVVNFLKPMLSHMHLQLPRFAVPIYWKCVLDHGKVKILIVLEGQHNVTSIVYVHDMQIVLCNYNVTHRDNITIVQATCSTDKTGITIVQTQDTAPIEVTCS